LEKSLRELLPIEAYYNKELIEEIEETYNIDIVIPHKKKRDPLPQEKEALYRKRAAIEAKISEGKRMTGMGKSYYSGFSGDHIWRTLGTCLKLKASA